MLVAMLTACGLALAADDATGTTEVNGGLDAAGGRGRSGAFALVSGSLGQGFQTGDMASSRYRLHAGLLQPLPASAPEITGDFNGDRTVDFADFLLFAGGYGRARGEPGYDARFDLDDDGTVGFQDFLRFAQAFGSGK